MEGKHGEAVDLFAVLEGVEGKVDAGVALVPAQPDGALDHEVGIFQRHLDPVTALGECSDLEIGGGGQPIIRPLDVEQVVRANEIAVGGIGEGQFPELAGVGFDLDTVLVTLQRQGFGLAKGVSMSSSVMAVRACMVVSTC